MLTNIALPEVSTQNSTVSLIDMQLKAYSTQVRYETKIENQEEIKKIYKDQADKQFWINIALILAAGYAVGNSK